tara:strand:+ start:36 stop:335 length:300 start_codon:yes stop_codon:yes gene_type:complete
MSSLLKQHQFDPDGDGYDMATARAAGMTPHGGDGPDKGHMGSVVLSTEAERKKFALPPKSYLMLKGRNHPTFHKAVQAEKRRGFKIIKIGGRYWSVPAE